MRLGLSRLVRPVKCFDGGSRMHNKQAEWRGSPAVSQWIISLANRFFVRITSDLSKKRWIGEPSLCSREMRSRTNLWKQSLQSGSFGESFNWFSWTEASASFSWSLSNFQRELLFYRHKTRRLVGLFRPLAVPAAHLHASGWVFWESRKMIQSFFLTLSRNCFFNKHY